MQSTFSPIVRRTSSAISATTAFSRATSGCSTLRWLKSAAGESAQLPLPDLGDLVDVLHERHELVDFGEPRDWSSLTEARHTSRVVHDAASMVVEIVRNAAGKLANGLERCAC